MFNQLHKKLLRKSAAYKKWHENKFHNVIHFVILFVIASFFAWQIQAGIQQGVYYNLASQEAYAEVVLGQFAPPSPLEGSLLSAGYGIFSFLALLIVVFGVAAFFVFLQ